LRVFEKGGDLWREKSDWRGENVRERRDGDFAKEEIA